MGVAEKTPQGTSNIHQKKLSFSSERVFYDLLKMNVFRLCGDLCHLAAIVILLLKIWKTRSCAGISGRSQMLFALVFITRYLDLFTSFISVYNTVMKCFFLVSSMGTVYLMYMKFKATYDHNHDTFRIEFLLGPAVLLALLLNHEFSVMEVLWTFSIYLESVAILPQLFMVSKQEKQSQSHPIIYLLLDLTELSTLSIGSIDTTQKVSTISLLLLLDVYKRSSTATSFIST